MRYQLHRGDSRELLKTLADNSVDSIVCDPPYHLTTGKKGGAGPASVNPNSPAGRSMVGTGFMGMTWDGGQVAHDPALWAEALRVAKPGAWLLAFGGTRTYHRLACAIEDAGWELRDSPVRGHIHQPEDCPWLMGWMFGSGFPKSHNGEWGGTALKPAWEPIVCARKPLIGTVEENWLAHGVGGLNIDGCRIAPVGPDDYAFAPGDHGIEGRERQSGFKMAAGKLSDIGRWPANLLHDGSPEVLACFPDAPGQIAPIKYGDDLKTDGIYGSMKRGERPGGFGNVGAAKGDPTPNGPMYSDTGSAARFFYCAKASQEDREEGISGTKKLFGMSGAAAAARGEHYDNGDGGVNRTTLRRNIHPTVKPTDLMRWLVRLVTPRGGARA